MNTITIKQTVQVNFDYSVLFTHGAFELDNKTLLNVLTTNSRRPAKILVVIDSGVAEARSGLAAELEGYMLANGLDLVGSPIVVNGGEQIKGEAAPLDDIYRIVAEQKIDRHSFIIGIGGGALLDAVGYAAATAHRGIRFVRMPTTVLAQNDAGIGVKNGVNYLDRKNFLGTFAPPFAVVNDFEFLSTLDIRDKRAGIAEAIKVALIKDKRFFDELYEQRFKLARFETDAVKHMIFRCAELHLEHIRCSGDPFEMGSSRPLDFGHWSAHKLEALSNYELRHGEAVAIGIALDCHYAVEAKMMSKVDCYKVTELLGDLGFQLSCKELQALDVSASLEEFREHLGGYLSIAMLTGLGSSVEVNHIDVTKMQNSLDFLIDLGTVHTNVIAPVAPKLA